MVCSKQEFENKKFKHKYDINVFFYVVLELIVAVLDQLQKNKVLRIRVLLFLFRRNDENEFWNDKMKFEDIIRITKSNDEHAYKWCICRFDDNSCGSVWCSV